MKQRKVTVTSSCLPAQFATGVIQDALNVSYVENICKKLEIWVTKVFLVNLNHYLLGCWYTHIQLDFSKAFMGTVTVKGCIVGHILEWVCWYIPGIKWSVWSL